MLTLVVDADNRKLYQEVEIVWEDGTVRNLTIEAHKSLRIDIDTLYQRPSIQPPTPE